VSPLFGHAKNNPAAEGVRASALVIGGDSGISGTTSWLSLARLRVMIPDRPPVVVTHECMVERGKELLEGFTIPIRVDPATPERLEIIWDEVPTIEQRIADRDPTILDPEGTWERLRAAQFAKLPPAVPRPVSPWAEKTIDGWPPAEPLSNGRQPGTAWIVASSLDARMCAAGDGDSLMPPGRNRYRCKGPVVYGSHSFMTWLLARVNPQYGEPYGAYWRTNAVRWRFSPVLPVALIPDDPTNIEVRWDAATNVAEKFAEKINTGVTDARGRVEAFTTRAAEAAAAMSAPTPSGLERLERLRDSGILSDAEFDAERVKLEAQQ
jgi:hypothetical protein